MLPDGFAFIIAHDGHAIVDASNAKMVNLFIDDRCYRCSHVTADTEEGCPCFALQFTLSHMMISHLCLQKRYALSANFKVHQFRIWANDSLYEGILEFLIGAHIKGLKYEIDAEDFKKGSTNGVDSHA